LAEWKKIGRCQRNRKAKESGKTRRAKQNTLLKGREAPAARFFKTYTLGLHNERKKKKPKVEKKSWALTMTSKTKEKGEHRMRVRIGPKKGGGVKRAITPDEKDVGRTGERKLDREGKRKVLDLSQFEVH